MTTTRKEISIADAIGGALFICGIIVVIFCAVAALVGCAANPVEPPCGYLPVARDSTPVQYVRVYCVGTEV